MMKEVGSTQDLIRKKGPEVAPLRKNTRKIAPVTLFRNAFKMKLKPGFKAEYKKRHDEIWPELSQVLKKAGISDYSIFLDEETDTLFAFQKLAANHTAGDLPNDLIVRKWWDYMSDIMEYNDDNTPVAIAMKEMFHAD
jgi:L-rhamnose mutarotase